MSWDSSGALRMASGQLREKARHIYVASTRATVSSIRYIYIYIYIYIHLCCLCFSDLGVFKVSLSRAPPSGLSCPQDGGHVHYASDQVSADVKRLKPVPTAMHRRAELCKAHKRKASIRIFASTRSRRVDIRSSGSNLARQILPQTLVAPLRLVLQDRCNDIKCCLSNSANASAKLGMVMSFSLYT